MNKITACLSIATVVSACSAEPGEAVQRQAQLAECWSDTIEIVRNDNYIVVGGTGNYAELEVYAIGGDWGLVLRNSEGKTVTAAVAVGKQLSLNGEDPGCGQPQAGCAFNECPGWHGFVYPIAGDANSFADVRMRTRSNCGP